MPPRDTIGDLFERAPCGLLATTPDATILAANETLLAWLGRRRDELLGHSVQELMTVPARIYFETHFAPLLRMQGFVREISFDLIKRDGTTVPVFASANEERAANGKPRWLRIAIFLAVDRRRYEREILLARRMAEQALEAKSQFLAQFAHEVRNPLSAARLAAELIREIGVPPASERPLENLRRALDQVIGLLESMLDFSRFEAGKATLQARRFELTDLIRSVAQTFEFVAEQKGLAIEVEIDPRAPAHLVGDAVRIGQVITNLAGNALKFTEEGVVTLGVELVSRSDRDCNLRFYVRDTGIGIPPDRLKSIFEEYEQGTPETAQRYGGTGLGLAISRRILEMHGAKPEVESSLGAGSTFFFQLSLPLA